MSDNVFRRIRKYVSKRKQQETLLAFQEEMFGYPVFFLLMVLASCIATIGLLRESQSILIGAMLITPLVNPLMGVPLGIVSKSWAIFRASLIRVLGGVLLFWGIAYLVSDLLIVFSPEIIDHQLWNTSKFLVELPEILMAIFAGIVAAISVASEKVHSLMAGAAIAIAMAPWRDDFDGIIDIFIIWVPQKRNRGSAFLKISRDLKAKIYSNYKFYQRVG